MSRELPYPTPGEILLEEFLKPMGISQNRLAKEIGVSSRRISEIVAGKRPVTAAGSGATQRNAPGIFRWVGGVWFP